MSEGRIPLLLDTDIGSDIDDAVCLAYLLRQPYCELLGITTVSGQPDKRAMIADAICREAGADVPIHVGAGEPLVVKPKQTTVPQADALVKWRHARVFPRGTAIPFMAETIRSRPGEVTLLTIGPLTGVARLFEADPEVPGLLRRVVMMCGVFAEVEGKTIEWNASLDPHALAAVCTAPVPSITAVGLDVTKKCAMSAADFRERFRGGVLDAVASFAEIWFKSREEIVFHDPLAAAVIFEPGICSYESGRIRVEVSDRNSLGKTAFEAGEDGPHEIAAGVDPDAFFEHYFDVIGA